MVGIVAEDTVEDIAVGTAAMDTATLGIVAGKVTGRTAVVRTSKAARHQEDTGSDSNPSHSRACASIPPLGSVDASYPMMTGPVAWRQQPEHRFASKVGTASLARALRVWV